MSALPLSKTDPDLVAKIRELRLDGYSSTDIHEKLKNWVKSDGKMGVGQKAIYTYSGNMGVTGTERQLETFAAGAEKRVVHSKKDIATHYNIDEKDVTSTHRSNYRKYLNQKKGQTFNKRLHKFKGDIRRIFPGTHEKILYDSRGKASSLDRILKHPSLVRKFGPLIDEAINAGLNPNVKDRAGSEAIAKLRTGIQKLFPKIVNIEGSGRSSITQNLITSKARELAYLDTGHSSNYRDPYYRNLAKISLMNLNPASRVDLEAPYQRKNIFNPVLNRSGMRNPLSILNVHHNLDIQSGGSGWGDTTVLPESRHAEIHADKQLNRLKEEARIRGETNWNTVSGNVEEPKLNLRKFRGATGRLALPAALWALAMGKAKAEDMPYVTADLLTGLDSEKFIKGMQDRQMQRHGQSYGDYARGSRVGQATSGILDFLTNEENEYRQRLMRNVDRFL